MNTPLPHKPLVLCVSGLDPTGGAGIQADIETLNLMGCHALPVVSSLTIQNTSNVKTTHPCDPDIIKDQIQALLDCGLRPQCIKLGLIDSPRTIDILAELLLPLQGIPVVADPVLKAGGGFEFSTVELITAYKTRLLPLCTVLTPNVPELYRLCASAESEDQALREITEAGCKAVLLTGTHADTTEVVNRLYTPDHDQHWQWPRLDGEFHGSGCTLASAMAAGIAHNRSLSASAEAAQHFTWHALRQAFRPVAGQYLPDRRPAY